MNIELLNELVQPLVIIGCLTFGYILKEYIPLDNKHIPLLLAITGIALSFALYGNQGVEQTIIAGALSGLASTGLHQAFHQYIKKDTSDQKYNELNGDR